MNVLIDAQLPRRLALWLNAQGHDAIHTLDLPQGNRSADQELALLADDTQRYVVTKDADFARDFRLRGSPRRLLLLSTGNLSNAQLLELWQRHLPALVAALEGNRFIELSSQALIVHE